MNNNLDPSPQTSVQLNGFAPAAGSSSSSSSSSSGVAISSSSPASLSASSTPDSAAVATASGGGASKPAKVTTTTTTAAAKRAAAKKRGPKNGGGGGGGSSPQASSSDGDVYVVGGFAEDTALRPLPDVGPGFEPMGLPQLRFRLGLLLDKLPKDLPNAPPPSAADRGVVAAEEERDPRAEVRSFASALQIAIEEYNLLLSLVSSAT